MNKILFYLIFILNIVYIIQAQPTNQTTGDGFWSQISTMRMEQIIWRNDTLFAARNPMYQSNGGVYRSIDGGVNWDTLYSVTDAVSAGVRLFLHPTDSRILFIINGSLYKSTNLGQSWTPILGGNGPLVRLAINPKNTQIMFVTKSVPFGTVYKTTNGGSSWAISGDGLLQDVYFAAGPIDINPAYPDTILLGTNAGLYKSTNGGLNWDTTRVKGFIPGVNIHPFLPNIAFASTTYDWSTYKTTNFGESWSKTINSWGATKYVFSTLFDRIIYSTENLKSNNYGDSWIKIDTIYSGWADLAINTSDNPTIFGINITYGLYKLTDIISTMDDSLHLNNFLKLSNFPNPFNSTTRIQTEVPQQSIVTIIIYNYLGQRIRTILNSTELQQGKHSFSWNGNDENGIPVASGIYLCSLFVEHSTKTELQTLKLVLLK